MMSEPKLSVEDAVRMVCKTAEDRKAFREQWPMYDSDHLRAEIRKADRDIAEFEAAITKVMQNKRTLEQLLRQCEKRDSALHEMIALKAEKNNARDTRP